jgi:phosphoglycerate kinase
VRVLKDISDVEGKKVLVRVDFDVPVENGKVTDETRIKAVLPSIQFLLSRRAKVILLAHLGRPAGRDQKFSLKPLIDVLERLLGQEVSFLQNFESDEIHQLNLLENLRFWPGEVANDENFAKAIASLGQFYVNDAFAVCHRAHASIVGLPKLLPSFVGLNLGREIRELSEVLEKPERPLVAIIGGAKIETKLPAINNLAKVADKVLVGGRVMFEISKIDLAQNVVVATDHVGTRDIGSGAIKIFEGVIARARLIVWSGPMGVFEEDQYESGTKAIANAVVGSQAYSIVGGGDTIAALNKFDLLDKIGYVSTGGGAMLEFLAGKKLPGLVALEG